MTASSSRADAPVRLSSPLETIKDRYDVVVVGSGYGGAIAASRMARAGRSVCLLERGAELQPGEYPNTELEAVEAFQLDAPAGHIGKRTDLFDVRHNDDLNVLIGCGLGGTSLINANVSLRPAPGLFDDPVWPADLRADVATRLDAGYERATEMLRPQPYPATFPELHKLDALDQSATELHAHDDFYRPPINVTFEDGVNHVGVEQKACILCGDCVSGCNYHAKNTTLMNYLPDARNHGAEIFTRTDVRRVEHDGERWVVHYQPLETGREAFDAPTEFVTADVVILGAGALGSAEILLRSKAESGLRTSDRVGSHFSGNGDVLAFAYNADEEIDGIGFGAHGANGYEPVGPCITGIIDMRDVPDLDDGMVIEEGSIPGGLAGIMPGLLASVSGIEGVDTDDADEGPELKRVVSSIFRGARHGATKNTQTFLVMTHDGARGELVLEDDRLRVKWPGVGSEPIFKTVDDRLETASKALGATYLRDPIWTRLLGHELITVHPLGGCPMGDDASAGAVDHRGRVFSGPSGTDVHAGLYVSDGSVVPRSLGVNPLLTISAITERCCALIAADHGWEIDYDLPASPPPAPAPAPTTTGIEFTERMAGKVLDQPFEFVLTIHGADVGHLIDDREHEAHMVGTVKAPGLSAQPLTVTDGTFNLFTVDDGHVATRNMRYRMRLTAEDGHQWWFEGIKIINDDKGLFEIWKDTTTLYVTLHDGPDENGPVLGKGELRISPGDFLRQMSTMRATDAPGVMDKLEAEVRFGRYFAATLFDIYGGMFAGGSEFDPGAPPRKRRALRVGPPEVHHATTDDGVDLRLTRYRGGDKGPLLVTHGLGVSSGIFTIDTIETNLLEYLYASNYDVWLLDYRASIDLPYSHTQFTADDVATRDYPTAAEVVLKLTGKDSLQVLAHCFGATTFSCAMLAGLPGVRSAVISQISTDVIGPFESKLKAGLHLPSVLDAIGVHELDAYTDDHAGWRGHLFDMAAKLIPAEQKQPCNDPVCDRITFMYAPLYDHKQLNQATHDALHEMFGVANMASFKQLAAMVRAKHLVGANGDDRYMPHVDRMAIPILFVHGEENACFLTPSIDKTIERLSKANGAELYTRHDVPGYGHIDCIFGRDAARDVFPHMVKHLDAT